MKRTVCMFICLCCLLMGCANPFIGNYVSVKPYEDQWNLKGIDSVTVSKYEQFYEILKETVEDGLERIAMVCPDFSKVTVDQAMRESIKTLLATDPIANYAVRDITYEWGKTGDTPALAVQVHYARHRIAVPRIQRLNDVSEAEKAIQNALEQCMGRLVFEIQQDEETDFGRTAEVFAREHPDLVMEEPSVTVSLYPESGNAHVVEMSFYYQTERSSLLAMKEQVEPVFTSASLYVSGDADELEKYQQLYSFLLERYDYHFDTSITPAYSLLRHGVGDSKAFASVYEAMCRRSDLVCDTISGTRRGESHSWNLIAVNGKTYHLDLLGGTFSLRTDAQMLGYVWDYSAYPPAE